MDSRQQFEAWFRQEIDQYQSFRTSPSGFYLNSNCQAHWHVWRASRQALVVELPIPDSKSHDPLYICAFGQSCREAIEAAGVTVKP